MLSFKEFFSEETYVPKDSMGISRKDMPQIATADVDAFAKEAGITFTSTKEIVSKLKPIQKEINMDKAREKHNQNKVVHIQSLHFLKN